MLKRPLVCIPKPDIEGKLKEALLGFKKTFESGEKVYEEMCFCILTPQSSARQAMKTINLLKEHNLLHKGSAKQKEPFAKNVRFFRTKAKRLVEVQERFPAGKIKKILLENGLPLDAIKCREFLHENVNGYGLKEASHFLRNIGFGENVAILDRHILKNLVKCGVIKEVPKHLTEKLYLEIEEKMREFCKLHKMNFAELDLIFWSNETGEVFK
ncbi:MAG: N-glycosylase/DNA lyase [archaeon]